MAADPKKDFRYRDSAGAEIEAYQVTKGARWASQDWPAWLQVQKSGNEMNRVYTDGSMPNSLFISLEAGEFAIEDDAYITFENGQLSVTSKPGFEKQFSKVVPFAPRILDEESLAGFEQGHRMEDGKLVKLEPGEVAELPVPRLVTKSQAEPVITIESGMTPKAQVALEMLLDGKTDAGIIVLRNALSDETQWCSCSPGNCVGGARWSCREKSPLV